MSDRKIKRIPKADVKPTNPLYDAFTYQMSAAIKLARKMESDKEYSIPRCVRRFLDEFGQKAA